MEQIFNRPEMQSAIIPFIVAFAVSAGLRQWTRAAWAWALLCAFLVSVLLINGATLTPMTGTRKIILLILGACLATALLQPLAARLRLNHWFAVVLMLPALAWIFWAVMSRREPAAIGVFTASAVAMVAWLGWGLDRLRSQDGRLHGAGLGLLLGTGLCAMAGSSALLGQLGLALAAATGGMLLLWVLPGGGPASGSPGNALSILPYLAAATLIGLAATQFARLPWYALVSLATIPAVTAQLPWKFESRFMTALVNSLPGLVIAAATALWVWQSGSSGNSGY